MGILDDAANTAFGAGKMGAGAAVNPYVTDEAGKNIAEKFGQTVGQNVGGAGGQGGFSPSPYGAPPIYYGGYEGGANDWSQIGLSRMGQNNSQQRYANTEMSRQRGPMAKEDQWLSDNEAMTRGWDQAGALQLAREAAMGQSPSEAQWLMQRGMNDAVRSTEGMRNSGRGAAGIALANQNASGQAANLQQDAFTQGGALRAAEMANARGMYGGLAGQTREQDLQRLQMGNQMGQFNAGLNDQYKLGMGQLANQYNQTGIDWYKAAQAPQIGQLGADQASQSIGAASYDQNQQLGAGMDQARKDAEQRAKDRFWGTVGTVVGVGGALASGGATAAPRVAAGAAGGNRAPAPQAPAPAPPANQGRYNPYDPGY